MIRDDGNSGPAGSTTILTSRNADVHAYDNLPAIWRQRLAECPIRFSAIAVREMLDQGYPDDELYEMFMVSVRFAMDEEAKLSGLIP